MNNSFTINLGKFKKAGLSVTGSDAGPEVLTSESGFDAIVKGYFEFPEYPEGSGTHLLNSIEIDISELASEIKALDSNAVVETNVEGNIVGIYFTTTTGGAG